jgi:hypothetical protein
MDHLMLGYSFPSKKGLWKYEFLAIGADRPAETLGFLATGDYKSIFAHRVLWEGKNLKIGVSELNLLRGVVPNLVDISPFGVYHNLYMDGYSNVMLDVFAQGRIGKSASLYGEFVMDDLVMPWESFSGRPTAFGLLAGGRWRILEGQPYERPRLHDRDYALRDEGFAQKGGLTARFEHYRTTSYLYGRETEYGRWTLPDHRLVGAFPFYFNEANAFALGFPWGPDTALTSLGLSWESRDLVAGFSLSLLRKGGRTIDSAYDTTNAEQDWFGLTGVVKSSIIVEISVEYSITRKLGLSAFSTLAFMDEASATVGCGLFFAP